MEDILGFLTNNGVGLEATWCVVHWIAFGRDEGCSEDGTSCYLTIEELLAGNEAAGGAAAGNGAVGMNDGVGGLGRIVEYHYIKGGCYVIAGMIGDCCIDFLSDIPGETRLRSGVSAFAVTQGGRGAFTLCFVLGQGALCTVQQR